jgi:outer membrane protein OmpA-like peptidoglycan-associated protein
MICKIVLPLSVLSLLAGSAAAQQSAPSASQIERSLEAAPSIKIPPEKRLNRKEIKRRFDIRRKAPSINIQAINFEFGSAEISYEERWKVERIGVAMNRILDRDPDEVFLIEGHTDAVGSRASNQVLSERRAASLRRVLVRYFGVPSYALETAGYGEDYLLVPTPYEEWRNRRVTLRRITDFLR